MPLFLLVCFSNPQCCIWWSEWIFLLQADAKICSSTEQVFVTAAITDSNTSAWSQSCGEWKQYQQEIAGICSRCLPGHKSSDCPRQVCATELVFDTQQSSPTSLIKWLTRWCKALFGNSAARSASNLRHTYRSWSKSKTYVRKLTIKAMEIWDVSNHTCFTSLHIESNRRWSFCKVSQPEWEREKKTAISPRVATLVAILEWPVPGVLIILS